MNSHSHTDCACVFSPAKMETLPTTLLVVSWICRIAAAVILLQTLYFKFTGAEESVYIFTKIGLSLGDVTPAAWPNFSRQCFCSSLVPPGLARS
jgi:hypothetical protein